MLTVLERQGLSQLAEAVAQLADAISALSVRSSSAQTFANNAQKAAALASTLLKPETSAFIKDGIV